MSATELLQTYKLSTGIRQTFFKTAPSARPDLALKPNAEHFTSLPSASYLAPLTAPPRYRRVAPLDYMAPLPLYSAAAFNNAAGLDNTAVLKFES